MGIRIRKFTKARPFMATTKHTVKFKNGTERTKLLSTEGAEEIRALDSVESVHKQAARAADKSRQRGADKAGRQSQTAGAGDQQSGDGD